MKILLSRPVLGCEAKELMWSPEPTGSLTLYSPFHQSTTFQQTLLRNASAQICQQRLSKFILAPPIVCTQVYMLEDIFSKDFLETTALLLYSPVRGIMTCWQSFPSFRRSWQGGAHYRRCCYLWVPWVPSRLFYIILCLYKGSFLPFLDLSLVSPESMLTLSLPLDCPSPQLSINC